MATTRTVSNEFKYEMGKKTVDVANDVFKLIVMASGFVYDQDTHGTYADVSGEEITSNGGYTVGGYTLDVDSAWAQDNADDRGRITWQDKEITASGEAFDTFCAAIIYDSTHSSDVVLGCFEYGEDFDIDIGSSFVFQDMAYNKT